MSCLRYLLYTCRCLWGRCVLVSYLVMVVDVLGSELWPLFLVKSLLGVRLLSMRCLLVSHYLMRLSSILKFLSRASAWQLYDSISLIVFLPDHARGSECHQGSGVWRRLWEAFRDSPSMGSSSPESLSELSFLDSHRFYPLTQANDIVASCLKWEVLRGKVMSIYFYQHMVFFFQQAFCVFFFWPPFYLSLVLSNWWTFIFLMKFLSRDSLKPVKW